LFAICGTEGRRPGFMDQGMKGRVKEEKGKKGDNVKIFSNRRDIREDEGRSKVFTPGGQRRRKGGKSGTKENKCLTGKLGGDTGGKRIKKE